MITTCLFRVLMYIPAAPPPQAQLTDAEAALSAARSALEQRDRQLAAARAALRTARVEAAQHSATMQVGQGTRVDAAGGCMRAVGAACPIWWGMEAAQHGATLQVGVLGS